MAQIILASASPRRKMLMEWAELEFDILVSETEESFPDHLQPGDAAVHVARGKALATLNHPVYQRYPEGTPIVAADTMVILDGQVIGKPLSRENAIQILESLSGQKHQVVTGVVIINPERELSFADTTVVEFHPLTREDIEFYVDKYKPYDKAGAYAIQEWIGVVGIKEIHGDFYNVMGLPVSKVMQHLANYF